jgi:hypothetical protein
MGFFDKMLQRLLNTKQQPAQQPTPQPAPQQPQEPQPGLNDYMSKWEAERQRRIQALEGQLKDWLTAIVKEKGYLSFTWESGNDEGFISFKEQPERDKAEYNRLEEYLFDKLDIPSAGEFRMDGEAVLYIQDNQVRVRYSSLYKEMIDYDEDTDTEVYGNEEVVDGKDELMFNI